MSEQEIAELSRLRAFSIRISPILKAALQLRALGRTLDQLEDDMAARQRGTGYETLCGTPWMIVEQAYETALLEFDAAVKKAGLGNFHDLLAVATGQEQEPKP
jgi:hypothetical protein